MATQPSVSSATTTTGVGVTRNTSSNTTSGNSSSKTQPTIIPPTTTHNSDDGLDAHTSSTNEMTFSAGTATTFSIHPSSVENADEDEADEENEEEDASESDWQALAIDAQPINSQMVQLQPQLHQQQRYQQSQPHPHPSTIIRDSTTLPTTTPGNAYSTQTSTSQPLVQRVRSPTLLTPRTLNNAAQPLLHQQATDFNHRLFIRDMEAKQEASRVASLHESELDALRQENARLAQQIRQHETDTHQALTYHTETKIMELSQLNQEYRQIVRAKDDQLTYFDGLVEEQQKRISTLEHDAEQKRLQYEQFEREEFLHQETLRAKLVELDQILQVRDSSLAQLSSTLSTLTAQCTELRHMVSTKDARISELESQVSSLTHTLHQLQLVDQAPDQLLQPLKTAQPEKLMTSTQDLISTQTTQSPVITSSPAPKRFTFNQVTPVSSRPNSPAPTSTTIPQPNFTDTALSASTRSPARSQSIQSQSMQSSASYDPQILFKERAAFQLELQTLSTQLTSITARAQQSINESEQQSKEQLDHLTKKLQAEIIAHTKFETETNALIELRSKVYESELEQAELKQIELRQEFESKESDLKAALNLAQSKLKMQETRYQSDLQAAWKTQETAQDQLTRLNQQIQELEEMNEFILNRSTDGYQLIKQWQTRQSEQTTQLANNLTFESSSNASSVAPADSGVPSIPVLQLRLQQLQQSLQSSTASLIMTQEQLAKLRKQYSELTLKCENEAQLQTKVINKHEERMTSLNAQLVKLEPLQYELTRTQNQLSLSVQLLRAAESRHAVYELSESRLESLEQSRQHYSLALMQLEYDMTEQFIQKDHTLIDSLTAAEKENLLLRQKLFTVQTVLKDQMIKQTMNINKSPKNDTIAPLVDESQAVHYNNLEAISIDTTKLLAEISSLKKQLVQSDERQLSERMNILSVSTESLSKLESLRQEDQIRFEEEKQQLQQQLKKLQQLVEQLSTSTSDQNHLNEAVVASASLTPISLLDHQVSIRTIEYQQLNASLTHQLNQANKRMKTLQEQFDLTLKRTTESTANKMEKYLTTIQELEQTIEELKSNSRHDVIKTSHELTKVSEAKVMEMGEVLGKQEKKHESALEELRTKYESTLEELRTQLQASQQNVTELKQETKRLQTKLDDLGQERSELQTNISRLEHDRSQSHEMENLQFEAFKASQEKASAEWHQRQARVIESLERKHELALEAVRMELSQVQQTIEQLNTTISVKEKELIAMKDHYEQTTIPNLVNTYQQQIKEYVTQVSDLTNLLRSFEDERLELKQKSIALEEERSKNTQQSELAALSVADINALNSQVKVLQDSNRHLKEQLDSYVEAHSHLDQRLNELQQAKIRLEAEVRSHADEYRRQTDSSAEKMINNLISTNNNLNSPTSANQHQTNQTITQLQAYIRTFEGNFRSLSTQTNQLISRQQHLFSQLDQFCSHDHDSLGLPILQPPPTTTASTAVAPPPQTLLDLFLAFKSADVDLLTHAHELELSRLKSELEYQRLDHEREIELHQTRFTQLKMSLNQTKSSESTALTAIASPSSALALPIDIDVNAFSSIDSTRWPTLAAFFEGTNQEPLSPLTSNLLHQNLHSYLQAMSIRYHQLETQADGWRLNQLEADQLNQQLTATINSTQTKLSALEDKFGALELAYESSQEKHRHELQALQTQLTQTAHTNESLEQHLKQRFDTLLLLHAQLWQIRQTLSNSPIPSNLKSSGSLYSPRENKSNGGLISKIESIETYFTSLKHQEQLNSSYGRSTNSAVSFDVAIAHLKEIDTQLIYMLTAITSVIQLSATMESTSTMNTDVLTLDATSSLFVPSTLVDSRTSSLIARLSNMLHDQDQRNNQLMKEVEQQHHTMDEMKLAHFKSINHSDCVPIGTHQTKLTELESKQAELIADHAQQLQKQVTEQKEVIAKLETQHRQQLALVREELLAAKSAEVSQLQSQMTEQQISTNELKQSSQGQIQSMQQKYEQQIGRLRDSHRVELQQLEQQLKESRHQLELCQLELSRAQGNIVQLEANLRTSATTIEQLEHQSDTSYEQQMRLELDINTRLLPKIHELEEQLHDSELSNAATASHAATIHSIASAIVTQSGVKTTGENGNVDSDSQPPPQANEESKGGRGSYSYIPTSLLVNRAPATATKPVPSSQTQPLPTPAAMTTPAGPAPAQSNKVAHDPPRAESLLHSLIQSHAKPPPTAYVPPPMNHQPHLSAPGVASIAPLMQQPSPLSPFQDGSILIPSSPFPMQPSPSNPSHPTASPNWLESRPIPMTRQEATILQRAERHYQQQQSSLPTSPTRPQPQAIVSGPMSNQLSPTNHANAGLPFTTTAIPTQMSTSLHFPSFSEPQQSPQPFMNSASIGSDGWRRSQSYDGQNATNYPLYRMQLQQQSLQPPIPLNPSQPLPTNHRRTSTTMDIFLNPIPRTPHQTQTNGGTNWLHRTTPLPTAAAATPSPTIGSAFFSTSTPLPARSRV